MIFNYFNSERNAVTHLFCAVLMLRAQFNALAAVSLALLVVGFLGVSVVALAVAETAYGAGEPFLQSVSSGPGALGSRGTGRQRGHRRLRLKGRGRFRFHL